MAPAPFPAPWAYLHVAGAAAVARGAGRVLAEALGGFAPTVSGLMGAAFPGLTAPPAPPG